MAGLGSKAFLGLPFGVADVPVQVWVQGCGARGTENLAGPEAGTLEPYHDPCAGVGWGGRAGATDSPCWGGIAVVEAGTHDHGRRLVGNHG
jgi:hypothetical protein